MEGRRRLRWPWGLVCVALIAACSVPLWYGRSRSAQSYPPDLRPFLESYFASWSAKDLKAYAAHFHERARVFYLNSGRQIVLDLNLEDFLAEQANAQNNVKDMKETMTGFTGDADAKAASLAVNWKLYSGATVKSGIDRFTLCRDGTGQWKIIALLFYEETE